jgi:hypothetical protein
LVPFDVAQGKLKKKKKLLAADLTPALSKGEGDKKEFFVHLFLQGFAAQKSTRSEKKWDLKSKTLGRIFYFTRA